ncbi:hypothetical protein D0Z07_9031 [Hyphodiscus hymeniophilus]|uniref:Carbonic anhydrase n=1 Tax=Hyphodiscus hymeniophilus TaxID=353542 RepID=A0A9P6VD77_9HELO|nr:hypothetical protein D0Z07_9031 [Hyphodiscus hymeniophilus]
MAAPKALTVAELIEHNNQASLTHQPLPTFAELSAANIEVGHTAISPSTHLPSRNPSTNTQTNGAIIFRNVGGHVTPCINDLLALDVFLTLTDILIIHHTDCGTTHFRDPAIRAGLTARLPERAGEIESMDFGAVGE